MYPTRKLFNYQGKLNSGMLQSQNVQYKRNLQRPNLKPLITGWTCISKRLLTICQTRTRFIYPHGWLRHGFMRNTWRIWKSGQEVSFSEHQLPAIGACDLWLYYGTFSEFFYLQLPLIDLLNFFNLSILLFLKDKIFWKTILYPLTISSFWTLSTMY